MPQGLLPFKYEAEKQQTGLTALGGLPVYLDLAHLAGLRRSADEYVGARQDSQGWTDAQMITALILLNLAGGECVDDLRILEADAGLCKVIRGVEQHGLPRGERRELERRWRKERKRTLPSPSAARRYLDSFHDADQEDARGWMARRSFRLPTGILPDSPV